MLETATRVLLASPSASLADVAAAAGVSRTTLHLRYPTRQDLLVALAHEALDLVGQAYASARLDKGTVVAALRRLVEATIPLGARTGFLLRERSLDADAGVARRYAALDAPLYSLVERGRASGELRSDLPPWWVVASLGGTVYTAWESIDSGRLAPRDATALVLTTMVDGLAARCADSRSPPRRPRRTGPGPGGACSVDF